MYLLSDGKQIDPKLIKVVPTIKRAINEVMKPPSLGTRRTVGCSWSAFRGKLYMCDISYDKN